ncbi:hypothetical protein HDU67_006908 [Dinochytrium kinnereticum]|nr:hypothetical protein HDU67_006908 [Dinochytrium kinnereticum]
MLPSPREEALLLRKGEFPFPPSHSSTSSPTTTTIPSTIGTDASRKPSSLPGVGTLLSGPASQYVLREAKGHGSFSTVYLAQCIHPPSRTSGLKRGDRVAVKCIVKAVANDAAVDAQRRECEFLKRLQPDEGCRRRRINSGGKGAAGRKGAGERGGVVGFYEMVESDDLLFFVLEYCPIDLYHAITQNGGFSQAVVKGLFPQIANAVIYCHERSIFHRDLKPENILIDTSDYTIRLTDFGLATDKPWSLEMGCGSVRYMAPECMGLIVPGTDYRSPSSKPNGYASAPNDVWALGIILINLIFARNPWHSPSDPFCLEAYLGRREPVLIGEFKVSKEFDSVLRRCFDPNPETRATVVQLRNLVAAVPWFIEPVAQSSPARFPVPGGLVSGGSPGTSPLDGGVARKSSIDVGRLSPRLPLTFLQISVDATRTPSISSNASSTWNTQLWDEDFMETHEMSGERDVSPRQMAHSSPSSSPKQQASPTPSPISRKARRMAPPSHIDLPHRKITDFGLHQRPLRPRPPLDDFDMVDEEDSAGYLYLSAQDWSGESPLSYDPHHLSPYHNHSHQQHHYHASSPAPFFSGVSPPGMIDAKMAAMRIAGNWTQERNDDMGGREEYVDSPSRLLAPSPFSPSHWSPRGGGLLPTPSEEDGPGSGMGWFWSPRAEHPAESLKKQSFDSGFESSSSALGGRAGSLTGGDRRVSPFHLSSHPAAASSSVPRLHPAPIRHRGTTPTPPLSPTTASGPVRRAQSDAVLTSGPSHRHADQQHLHRFASFNNHYVARQAVTPGAQIERPRSSQEASSPLVGAVNGQGGGALRRSSVSVHRALTAPLNGGEEDATVGALRVRQLSRRNASVTDAGGSSIVRARSVGGGGGGRQTPPPGSSLQHLQDRKAQQGRKMSVPDHDLSRYAVMAEPHLTSDEEEETLIGYVTSYNQDQAGKKASNLRRVAKKIITSDHRVYHLPVAEGPRTAPLERPAAPWENHLSAAKRLRSVQMAASSHQSSTSISPPSSPTLPTSVRQYPFPQLRASASASLATISGNVSQPVLRKYASVGVAGESVAATYRRRPSFLDMSSDSEEE